MPRLSKKLKQAPIIFWSKHSPYTFLGRLKFRLQGANIGRATFHGTIDIRRFDDSTISVSDGTFLGNCQIWTRGRGTISIGRQFLCEKNVRLNCGPEGRLIIGDNVGVGAFSIINAFSLVTIGNNCLISSHVHIIDADHGQMFLHVLLLQESLLES